MAPSSAPMWNVYLFPKKAELSFKMDANRPSMSGPSLEATIATEYPAVKQARITANMAIERRINNFIFTYSLANRFFYPSRKYFYGQFFEFSSYLLQKLSPVLVHKSV